MKFEQLLTKNKLSRPFSTTLFVFLIFSMILFMSSLGSAAEFDNRKVYDEVGKKVTITNLFGLASIFGTVSGIQQEKRRTDIMEGIADKIGTLGGGE